MRLSELIIKDGLKDIANNENKYGVARLLLESILAYKNYRNLYEMIAAGYLYTGRCDLNRALYYAGKGGHKNLVYYYIYDGYRRFNKLHKRRRQGEWSTAMYGAAVGGHKDLIDYCIANGANNWQDGLKGAAINGSKELVEFFISKGANNWSDGLHGASVGGHLSLIYWFIDKGAVNLNIGLLGATKGGHLHLIEFFLSRVAVYSSMSECLEDATYHGHLHLVKFFMNQYKSHFKENGSMMCAKYNALMRKAIASNNLKVVEYINEGCKQYITSSELWNKCNAYIKRHDDYYLCESHRLECKSHKTKYIDYLNEYISYATRHNRTQLIHYFIDQGASNWDLCIREAYNGKHKRLVKFFKALKQSKN